MKKAIMERIIDTLAQSMITRCDSISMTSELDSEAWFEVFKMACSLAKEDYDGVPEEVTLEYFLACMESDRKNRLKEVSAILRLKDLCIKNECFVKEAVDLEKYGY